MKRITKVWRTVFDGDGLRERKITAITADDCAALGRGISGFYVTTYNNTIATLKHIFAIAVKRKLLRESPAAKLKRLGKIIRVHGCVVGEHGEELTEMERADLAHPDVESPRWYPTPEQLAQVFAQMRSYKFGPCQAAADFAELLSATGCRLSEASKLRWSDLDVERNRLLIHGANTDPSTAARGAGRGRGDRSDEGGGGDNVPEYGVSTSRAARLAGRGAGTADHAYLTAPAAARSGLTPGGSST